MMNLIVIDTKAKTLMLRYIKELKIEKLLYTDILTGRNGTTALKIEGDGKTPLGTFEIGIAFGIHDRSSILLDSSLEYVKITPNLYWVDDVNSKYYNKLADITRVNVDWKSAEHLIDYAIQYEYAIEVKTNPDNVPGLGSAIFIHCSNGRQTAGCIAIKKEEMKELLAHINKDTKVVIV